MTIASSPNNWDSNYWNDYQGQDNNGDGIGDIPHLIDSNNRDNHPLMSLINLNTEPQLTIPT